MNYERRIEDSCGPDADQTTPKIIDTSSIDVSWIIVAYTGGDPSHSLAHGDCLILASAPGFDEHDILCDGYVLADNGSQWRPPTGEVAVYRLSTSLPPFADGEYPDINVTAFERLWSHES